MDKEAIKQILMKNKDKNFVDRILNKDSYGDLDNGDGSTSTHSMAWGEMDGKGIVFPTVVQDKSSKKKNLKRLEPQEAFKYAMENNEYIMLDSTSDAASLSEEYKRMWDNSDVEYEKALY